MMRLAPAVLVAFFSGVSAAAEPDEVPCAALEEAIALAEAHKDDRFAFTVEYWTSEGEKDVNLKLRFDPSQPQGAHWRLIAPELDSLDETTRKQVRKLEKIERPDDKLVYDRARDIFAGAEFLEERSGAYLYSTPINDEKLPEGALQAKITLNKDGRFIEKLETHAVKPFKPASVAKINAMTQTQVYSPPTGDLPALLSMTESSVQGSAMFKKFDINNRELYSDIERVIVDESDLPD